jgi:hypothetical protein
MTLSFSFGVARHQQVRDPLQHKLGLPEHLMVPKAQHLVSPFSQKIRSRFVLFHFGSVLPSVKLDYQAMFETAEIGNERTDSERDSRTRPLGFAALRLVSDIDAGTSRRTTAARAIGPKENAPLPFPRTAAVVRIRVVWMAYPRMSTLPVYRRIPAFRHVASKYAARGITHATCVFQRRARVARDVAGIYDVPDLSLG